jgi:hypothetical protein
MEIIISFALVGGINFGLEKSWRIVEGLLKKYPEATWKKIVGRETGQYIVDIK